MAAEPWQKYEIPGPTKAVVITKPEVVSALVTRAKNPILVAGFKTAEIDFGNGKKPIDYVIRIAKAANIPVVATAHTVSEFLKRDFKPTAWMSAMDIGNRLTDPTWSVTGKNPPHDLALIIGISHYYMSWLIMSGLKSFAYKHLKTVSIDQYYYPHCNWSFPNLSLKDWEKNLTAIAENLEKGRKK
ncbi:MAG: CO dehydrogenase/acetyl-CoA synthase complex subunit epsilon [Candidatus Hecatellales archaeon]|nr:MAG: CO dehydrogenase/acetyl-CoA synthase complex subunit epsilon [Candidatus Hecatellales archaeon]